MLELAILEGPHAGETLATDGSSLFVTRPAVGLKLAPPSPATPIRAGGWVVRPFAGGERVAINGRPADGRTALALGDRIAVGSSVFEVRCVSAPSPAAPPRSEAAHAEKRFALRFEESASPPGPRRPAGDARFGSNEAPGSGPVPAFSAPAPRPGGRVSSSAGRSWRWLAGAALLLVSLASLSLLLGSEPAPVAGAAAPVGPGGEATPPRRPVAPHTPPRAWPPHDPADPRAALDRDRPGVLFLLDASPAMIGRMPTALLHLRDRLENLPPGARYRVVVFDGRGPRLLIDAPNAATASPPGAGLAFRGRGDRVEALRFAIARAHPGDRLVLITGPDPDAASDASAFARRVSELMAGCDLSLSLVELFEDRPDPALRRLAEDLGGRHDAIRPAPAHAAALGRID